MYWQTSRFLIDLKQPKVMGIVNLTPDSFSDGGQFAGISDTLNHCERLLKDGADILDLGAESTRPGALPVSASDELARLVPVLKEVLQLGVPVSVDTYKPEVMQVVLDLGADIINDVWALRWRESGSSGLKAPEVIIRHGQCGVCLMHMHGEPLTMQVTPMQGDVMPEVLLFLEQSAQYLKGLGVDPSRIILDPGIGFGKTREQNFSLLARQTKLLALGYPVLSGWSRKSSLGEMALPVHSAGCNGSSHPRTLPSVVAALLSVERGASVVRVHDVRETVSALKVLHAINSPL